MTLQDSRNRPVPARALVLSVAALAVPVLGALGFAESLGEYGGLLWLMALVPAFLLSYYRGWLGVATAMAVGMATLSTTQAAATWVGLRLPEILLGVVVAYVGISLAVGLLADVFHRERDAVEDMAFTDLLTRLPNRRHARIFLENEFAAAQRGRLLTVVLFDLDGFKKYNDTYGHQVGDDALRAFADVLARTTRRMNLSARFGGEEYLSVLAGSDAEGARVFADRVRLALRSQHLGEPPLTVSAGVATFHPSMRSPDDLLAAADRALYDAKHEGRDCVRVFADSGFAETTSVYEPEPHVWEGNGRGPITGQGASGNGAAPELSTPFGEGHRVLLVERDEDTSYLIATYLRSRGFEVVHTGEPREAIRALRDEFDIVITSLSLPAGRGTELVSVVKSRWPTTQVVVIAGLTDAQTAADALNAGADRYLFKPFGMPELRNHLADVLARREQVLLERAERTEMAGEARLRDTQAREAVLRGAMALVRAVEVRDPYTRGHSSRVGAYAAALAPGLDPTGTLLEPDRLRLACELHDVGKIGVADSVLNKEGRLNAEEMDLVREHPRVGRRILEPLLDDELILAVTAWHHERWDGAGYPDGLSGEAIPVGARVVAMADTLDAMTCPRAYRDAIPWDEAIEELRAGSGRAFDPALVAYLDQALPALKRIHDTLLPAVEAVGD